MNNTKNKYCFESSSSTDRNLSDTIKSLKYFFGDSEVHEMSVVNKNNFNGVLTSKPDINSQKDCLFKVPTLDNLPVKQAKVKIIKSPSRRVQTGRIRNDLKTKTKLSLIPRPSFINSSKSLHCSRSTQLNARKELIKKMVFLAECTLKENQINQSTPVKTLAGLTPKKTPRSGGYFMLPEFNKKIPKLEEIRSPIEDFIKKEMFSYSAKLLNEKTPLKPCENKIDDLDLKNKGEITANVQGLPDTTEPLNQILHHCELYNNEVTFVHEKIKNLDEDFESKLNQIPEYKIYNEFCVYQLKKEDLYKDLNKIDEEFRNCITIKMNTSSKLKIFMKRKEELLDKQRSLLKDFKEVVQIALKKFNEKEAKTINKEKKLNETPNLRRSLRLSKISEMHETTPVTKKLKKLNSKSRGIQKNGRL